MDPLTVSYPMLTPYQFASNTPIMASDLDGLEGRLEIITRQEDLGLLKGTISADEVRENQKARATGAIMGAGILLDIFVTRGWVSKSVAAVSFGDLVHSTQMQTHYRDMGMPSTADQFKQEGGQAATEFAIDGLTHGMVKGLSRLVEAAPRIPSLKRLDDAIGGRNFWKNSTTFDGVKVYQRDDIFDANTISSWKENGKTITGTNVERMSSGRAPIGVDGKSVNLHHMIQSDKAGMAEMTQTFHKSNSNTIHINPNTVPSGIDRGKFDTWRSDYWKNRANDF